MIKLLGRQTSGNVQKVIFCLEEMRVPYVAGRAWFALERFTIADIALGTIVKRCLEFPIERPPLPRADALAGHDRGPAGLCSGSRRQGKRVDPGSLTHPGVYVVGRTAGADVTGLFFTASRHA
jgi:hypothetical protein